MINLNILMRSRDISPGTKQKIVKEMIFSHNNPWLLKLDTEVKNTKEESILSSFDAVDEHFEFYGLPKEQITRY